MKQRLQVFLVPGLTQFLMLWPNHKPNRKWSNPYPGPVRTTVMRTHWVGKCHFICSCYKIQFRQSFGLIYLWHWVSTRGPILVRRPKNYPGPSHQDLHRGRHWVSSSCSNRFALISLFCLCVTFEPMLKTVSPLWAVAFSPPCSSYFL